MSKWRIKTRRDWLIAAGFLFLVSYLAAGRFQQRINDWLMNVSPEKMGYFNQPENHGVYMLAALLAGVMGTALWIWQRRMQQKRLAAGIEGIWAIVVLATGCIWAAYQAECHGIVNTPWESGLTPHVDVQYWGTGGIGDQWELTEEEQEQILQICLTMEAPSKEEQAALREQITEENQISISIWYPEYKNHSYHLWFFLEGDILYLNRGHTPDDAVYYDGTKLYELLNNLKIDN